MDGNGQTYYNTRPTAYFASDQFTRAPITVGGAEGSPGNCSPPPPACIYAERAAAAAAAAHQNGYGGSPMAVVESRLEDVGLAAAQYPRMHHSNVNMMALANMTLPQEGNGGMCSPSCAQVSSAVSLSQCSAGVGGIVGTTGPGHHHQRHLHQQNMGHHLNGSSACGQEDIKPKVGDNGMNGMNGKNLPFPWMKTTKSHAHMWKANWPGKVLHFG